MKDSLKILIIIIIGLVLLQNCKKESNDKPRNDFSADLLIKRLIRYSNDSAVISFEVSPKDGNGPYSYTWIMPDTLKGSGPFSVNLVEDLKIIVKITDANSKQLDFSYIIKKDTIDFLEYDYRNDFNADLLIKRLICYPNDSISLNFEVSPKDGNGPYTYKWIMPDTLNGSGPFTVNLVKDLKILVKIIDANSKQLDFSFLIKKDTIDPLKNDYRNEVVGKYLCDFISTSPIYTDSGWKLIDKKFQDTLKVYKSEIFNNIICRSNIELIYDLKRNEFGWSTGNTWSYVHVINDSIYYSYTRLARYWVKAKGKRINN